MKSIIVSMIAAAGLMVASSAMATEVPDNIKALIKENGFLCLSCHQIDVKVVGPAWADVAKKYKGVKTYKYSKDGSEAADAKEYPLVDGLIQKVSHGGKGNWGSAAMSANDPSGAKQPAIKEMSSSFLAWINNRSRINLYGVGAS